MHAYTIDYMFQETARQHRLEIDQSELQPHEAAMHMLELHFGDAENSLMMPNADAMPEEILGQAGVVGLTEIRVAPDRR
ncbi:hypothetical protein ALP03_00060 [Pseudomonas amygdali pv. tabaci]|uniref:Uncharacterized protein n=1 Tax=Pseudomonas amygdali pv. tabaci TaxID=322 RepID=A0A3M6HY80_PSEAJ|nr:hypothetical protein ALP03_00060 [Pseudomonas amygdali pv. tabaci]